MLIIDSSLQAKNVPSEVGFDFKEEDSAAPQEDKDRTQGGGKASAQQGQNQGPRPEGS